MLSGPPWQALSNICNDTHARAWVSLQADLLRAPNTVIAVMQKGYELNGRVIRPAMVMVSKSAD